MLNVDAANCTKPDMGISTTTYPLELGQQIPAKVSRP